MSVPKTTPMMKQYLEIKEQHPDALLFYRMGDFYEMFLEDAEVASRVLDITLTSRNKNDANPIPMCGVPYRAAQGYIAKLIESGFRVAVCDQVEDPAAAKGLVKREVVRVVTPGMVIEDAFLEAGSHNFVLAFSQTAEQYGIAFLDLSTGTFKTTECSDFEAILDEIQRIAPKEILMAQGAQDNPQTQRIIQIFSENVVSFQKDAVFQIKRARQKLTTFFNTVSLEGFGCQDMGPGLGAAGAILVYVDETQLKEITHIVRIEPYVLTNFMIVDDLSCRNLELLANIRSGRKEGTLLKVLDKTVSALGGRLLRHWMLYPLKAVDQIEQRLQAVAEAKEQLTLRRHLRAGLKDVSDLERLSAKIAMGQANARDLIGLKRSFARLPEIVNHLTQFQHPYFSAPDSNSVLEKITGLIEKAIREDAPPTISEGRLIKSGYDAELDNLIQISRDSKSYLARLERQEREKTGITSLKVRYNKVFGYYIEIPKSKSAEAPVHYVRKQTLVNAERFITEELKIFENNALNAESQRTVMETTLFKEICKQIMAVHATILEWAGFLARLDCVLNFAEIADQNRYVMPTINCNGCLHIEEGRHPVVEQVLSNERFVPNTIMLDNQSRQVLIITGPNMAGKSTVLRQVALTVLMAHMGSFVPAKNADLSLTDRIFTRVGALDNLSQGQSTFMVEMQETANILNNATPHSLVIMDEIGRGTSTFDGMSIAWAVAEYLHDLDGQGVKTLFATHYHELTELAENKTRVCNMNIAVKEWNDQIIFLRKLVDGGTNRSYGIQVARLAGVPQTVVKAAKHYLNKIQNRDDDLGQVLASSSSEGDMPHGPVQIQLFRSPQSVIIERLASLDLNQMTPLEALNVLQELKTKAQC